MLNNKEIVLRWLFSSPQGVPVDRVRRWLESEQTRDLSERVPRKTASELIHLWKVRVENSRATGLCLEGADDLLARLQVLTPQQKVEQYAFTGDQFSGSLFFLRSNHEYVGAVLVPARGLQRLAS